MILGVDLSSNNPVFNFALAQSQGCRTAYIKEGGDNIPRYISGSYAARVDAAKQMGWQVGSYWITGGHDPAAAADFAAAHLEAFGPADYIVLDNETLDSGNVYNDAEAAAWVRQTLTHVGGNPARILHYGSKSFIESHAWPQLLATGCSFLIADYNGTPLQNHIPSTIPASRVVGHQYADNGSIGGALVDVNAFVDSFLLTITAGLPADIITALENDDMMLITSTGKRTPLLIGPLGSINITDPLQVAGLTATVGAKQLNDLQLDAIHNAVNAYAANAKLYLNSKS
jgi:GH25 family lysozyme M1 (1,4-beta-N-acetylmuramidase)